jgi:Pentapeptide repeats (8 copies)
MASHQAPPPVGADDSWVLNTHPISKRNNPNANSVQRTRAWTGLWVVVGGDVAIAAAAIFTVFTVWKAGHTSSNITPIVAVLTSAFTAIGTMTTAYFGIKTMANTAQSFAPAVHAAAGGAPDHGDPFPGPHRDGVPPPGAGGRPSAAPDEPRNTPPGPRPSAPTGPPPTRPSPPTGPVQATGLAALGLAPPDAPSPSGTFLAAPTLADPELAADLVEADLVGSDLVGVDLVGVDLVGVDLDSVEISELTEEPPPDVTDAGQPPPADAASEE